jgi:hypothetical protein
MNMRAIIGTSILGALAAILASCEPAKSPDPPGPTPTELAEACSAPARPHRHAKDYDDSSAGSLAEQLNTEEFTTFDRAGDYARAARMLGYMCPELPQARSEGCYSMLSDYCSRHQLAPTATNSSSGAPSGAAAATPPTPAVATTATPSLEDLVRSAADTLSWPPSLASREIHCGIDATHPADCLVKIKLSADDDGAARTALLKACQAVGIAVATGGAVTGGAAAVFTPKQVYASLALPMAACKAMGHEMAKGQGADRDAIDRGVLDFASSADIRVGPLPR